MGFGLWRAVAASYFRSASPHATYTSVCAASSQMVPSGDGVSSTVVR